MSSRDEQVLRAAKEVVIKFIEIGRISPATFPESFKQVYETIDTTVRQPKEADLPPKKKKS
ncbi:hypothetical protein [Desulfosudis oleivorans]|jgi:hypothetical protein|uniref:hypothetical protein n=1 Tax=Desulfosudis oleivorans TaxID=181663 RepID=UPI00059DA51C|nr:hypothetical protein [Desulfosudis oleivorans]